MRFVREVIQRPTFPVEKDDAHLGGQGLDKQIYVVLTPHKPSVTCESQGLCKLLPQSLEPIYASITCGVFRMWFQTALGQHHAGYFSNLWIPIFRGLCYHPISCTTLKPYPSSETTTLILHRSRSGFVSREYPLHSRPVSLNPLDSRP